MLIDVFVDFFFLLDVRVTEMDREGQIAEVVFLVFYFLCSIFGVPWCPWSFFFILDERDRREGIEARALEAVRKEQASLASERLSGRRKEA
jgi:hypothetical protein